MKIKVELFTILKKYDKGKILENHSVILDEGTNLLGLTRYLEIPDRVGIIFLVNQFPKDKEYVLKEGDEVKLYSLICGG